MVAHLPRTDWRQIWQNDRGTGPSEFDGALSLAKLPAAGHLHLMPRLRKSAVAVLITFAIACPLVAAADSTDFYLDLLHRGIAHVDAGQYDAGSNELRIAAFGLLDAVPQFETAQIYLAIAADHLKNEADARRAVQRVIAADRIERKYGSLTIPAATRTAFEKIATKLLTSDQVAFLRGSPTPVTNPPAVPPPVAAPQPSSAPVPAPQPTPTPPPPVASRQPVHPPVPTPVPSRPAPVPAPAPVNINAQLALADKALERNDLASARTIYQSVIKETTLDHATLLRIGEQSYRARDFATAARAFGRSGFVRGEQPYHYYYAVALYETGQHEAAKRELALAVPYIEMTEDVARYRARIEAAR
jgi:hypothetical protein